MRIFLMFLIVLTACSNAPSGKKSPAIPSPSIGNKVSAQAFGEKSVVALAESDALRLMGLSTYYSGLATSIYREFSSALLIEPILNTYSSNEYEVILRPLMDKSKSFLARIGLTDCVIAKDNTVPNLAFYNYGQLVICVDRADTHLINLNDAARVLKHEFFHAYQYAFWKKHHPGLLVAPIGTKSPFDDPDVAFFIEGTATAASKFDSAKNRIYRDQTFAPRPINVPLSKPKSFSPSMKMKYIPDEYNYSAQDLWIFMTRFLEYQTNKYQGLNMIRAIMDQPDWTRDGISNALLNLWVNTPDYPGYSLNLAQYYRHYAVNQFEHSMFNLDSDEPYTNPCQVTVGGTVINGSYDTGLTLNMDYNGAPVSVDIQLNLLTAIPLYIKINNINLAPPNRLFLLKREGDLVMTHVYLANPGQECYFQPWLSENDQDLVGTNSDKPNQVFLISNSAAGWQAPDRGKAKFTLYYYDY